MSFRTATVTIFTLSLSLAACGQPDSVTVEERDAAMPVDQAQDYGTTVSEETRLDDATNTGTSMQDAADPGDMETVGAEETGM